MKKIAIILMTGATLFSCSKEQCEKDGTGELKVSNYKADPYNIYVDGDYVFTLGPNENKTIDEKVGSHILTVEQKSGYIANPTVVDDVFVITECTGTAIAF